MKENKFILFFYGFGFLISLFLGIKFGFGNSHTPPFCFFSELLVLTIGIVLLTINLAINNFSFGKLKFHFIGLLLNLSLLLYILYPTIK